MVAPLTVAFLITPIYPDVGTKGRLISFLQNMAKKKQQQLLVTNNVFEEAKKSHRILGYFSKNICDQ